MRFFPKQTEYLNSTLHIMKNVHFKNKLQSIELLDKRGRDRWFVFDSLEDTGWAIVFTDRQI